QWLKLIASEFSAENSSFFAIFGSWRKESCGFFRNIILAKAVTKYSARAIFGACLKYWFFA
ncbi:hypothetical protein, partial [Allotamlana fucoidanivorans]|uniref:hypothetical protein n=1 Tax=Allotamlana fucoidanivorans TaxID=2583814 RepID=UPI001E3FF4ED